MKIFNHLCGLRRHVYPGDTIEAAFNDKTIAKMPVEEGFSFDGVVFFEVEEGAFDDNVVGGLGAAFVDTKGKGFTINGYTEVESL